MLPFLTPESGSDVNESPIHRNDDIVKFLIDGKMVTSEEAESAYPLDEESQRNEAKRLENMREVRELEASIAQRIKYLSDNAVGGELVIEFNKNESTATERLKNKAFGATLGILQDELGLMDLVDPDNTESYGTIYAGSDYGIVSPEYVNMLSNDPNKLWEKGNFQENGKYNQISLSDSGEFFLTIIQPGAVQSIRGEVPINKVAAIREYSEKYSLNWDDRGEGFKNNYSGLGGVYQFMRVMPLLRQGNGGHNIDLVWRGQDTNPFIEGGPFTINNSAEILVRPVEYPESE